MGKSGLLHMRRLSAVIVVILIATFFLGGYIARESYDAHALARNPRLPSSGLTAYASESTRSDVGPRSDIDISPMETFYTVLRLLKEHFVEPIEDSQRRDLTYGALRNMLDSLKDPNTKFLEPDQKDLVDLARRGEFRGIGAVLGVRKIKNEDGTFEKLVVVSSLPGSSAEKADLRSDDVITEIDGKSVLPYDPFQRANRLIKLAKNGELEKDKLSKTLQAEEAKINDGIGFQKAAEKLAAPFKDSVELTIERSGQTVKVKVPSGNVTVDPIEYSIKNNVGYIDVNLFTAAVKDQFTEALADIEKKGAAGLVIDLRNDPGGSIDMARQVARLLAPEKAFAIAARSSGKREVIKIPAARSDVGAVTWTKPVVVLVDRGTASASELLAGALRDDINAKLIGTRTFGQAFEVTMLPQRDGSAVEMTTGKFLTPKGTDFNIKGLKVDFEVEGREAQLDKAIALAGAG